MTQTKGSPQAIHGHVIPKRRFTRWALYYLLLYFCMPLLALIVVIDVLLYAISTGIFGRCFALLCLLG
ncbi:MAG: hypothetical protein RH942_07465 [Kiloniellaceae bacterium]